MERRNPFGCRDIGTQISSAREAAGVTQAELARRIGRLRQAVYRYEVGERTPSALVLREIAVALEVSADQLLGLTSPGS